MDDILEAVASGAMSVEDARRALSVHAISVVGDYGRFDTHRDVRTGIPEVILGDGKTPQQIAGLARAAAKDRGHACVSRIPADVLEATGLSGDPELHVAYREDARFAAVHTTDHESAPTRGTVGVLTAGTSDLPVAAEAAAMAEAMGTHVVLEADCGVAGPARLRPALERVLAANPGALVVAAGREGTLPTLVAALAPVPVIGLPVSTGYGAGGQGQAALHSMLQSCAPLAVVNIDAGVIAGAMAARIARLAARATPPALVHPEAQNPPAVP